jgi:hypothetical protein
VATKFAIGILTSKRPLDDSVLGVAPSLPGSHLFCESRLVADTDGGTNVLAVHDGRPRGLSTADSEVGWQKSLPKLAALVEAG